jgi:putative oxidoreductase
MKLFMARYNSQGYALMRIVAGFLFLWRGAQKLHGIPSAILQVERK